MLTKLIRQLPAETAHRAAVLGLKYAAGMLPAPARFSNLTLDLGLGRPLSSPIALAAGFDKDAEAVLGAQRLGFGAVEVGSITPLPQPGNPQPRVFRLEEDDAVINRYGFNSGGAAAALARLQKIKKKKLTGPLGINLGKNKDGETLDDYRSGLVTFAPVADYLTINLSSPNTPGLRDEQNLSAITALIEGLKPDWPQQPVLIKLAPDLADDDLTNLVDYLGTTPTRGIIIGNTTLSRPVSLLSDNRDQAGGLSGKPLFDLALSKLSLAARVNRGLPSEQQMLLVGCGGIDSAHRALRMIRHGADFVQLYSSMSVHGPRLITQMNAEISAIMDSEGFASIRSWTGIDVR